jgi:predicted PurR-regulated permease PerM
MLLRWSSQRLLSFALEPPVNLLARRGWRRGLGTAVVFAAIAVAVLAFVAALGSLLALPAAASVQALVSIYLHRYEVIASPLTGAPTPSATPAHGPPGRAGAEATRRVE